jgi:ADP-ribosyl-[dinitrogen reductase] hydrolase
MDERTRARCIGAVVGLAVGDALGTTLEFKRPGSFTPIDDMVGGGPFNLEPGFWTDDTSMALCLAESLAECAAFDATDQMQRYLRWYREGHWSSTGTCFDIGNATREALASFERSGDPCSGSTSPRKAGNGSLMRLAPVPVFFRDDPERAIEFAADSSRTTHGAETAVDACRYFAGLIVGALQGLPKPRLLAERFHPVRGQWSRGELHPEIEEVAAGSFLRREPPQIRGTGFVVQSLEAAMWAFARGDDFRSGALLAVNLGDDADTTGAIYGQLAGAHYGFDGIPAHGVAALVKRDQIQQLAGRLITEEE